MLTALLLLTHCAAVLQDSPRLKTELPNRARILAETFPGARLMAVQLFASVRGAADTPETHGYRHLLEHLIVKGTNGDLDMRLESKGVFLKAETYRDFMHVSIVGPYDQLDLALDAIKQILTPPHWTQDQLAKEAKVIAQELVLLPDSILFSNALWLSAFGDAGIDPMGDAATIAKATPEQLMALHRAHFASQNLLLVVSGPVKLDDVTRKATALLGGLRPSQSAAQAASPEGKPGRVDVPAAFGEARAALVQGAAAPKTAAVLAAALAISSLVDASFVTWTPTIRPGLVIVGQTEDNNGLGRKIDAMSDAERATYFEAARNLAHRWISSKLGDPVESGLLRGELLVLNWSARPDDLLDNVDKMTLNDFLQGFQAFEKERCIVGVGVPK